MTAPVCTSRDVIPEQVPKNKRGSKTFKTVSIKQVLRHTHTSSMDGVRIEREDIQTEQDEIDHVQTRDDIRPCEEPATNRTSEDALYNKRNV